MKENNYNKYWRSWSVLQQPKINFDLLAEDWQVFDNNLNSCSTIAIKEDIEIRADYANPCGVEKLRVKKGDTIVYEQRFNYLLKPSVEEIKKVLEKAGIEDWRKYYSIS